MLTVKGKVLGHPEYRKQVRLKFDDEPPFTVSYAGTTDSSSNTIFLNSTSKILSKFKSSETLVMEIPIFMEGTRRIRFNVKDYSEYCKF